jgi:hypothetical protein
MYSLAQILQNWALIFRGGLLGTGVLIGVAFTLLASTHTKCAWHFVRAMFSVLHVDVQTATSRGTATANFTFNQAMAARFIQKPPKTASVFG